MAGAIVPEWSLFPWSHQDVLQLCFFFFSFFTVFNLAVVTEEWLVPFIYCMPGSAKCVLLYFELDRRFNILATLGRFKRQNVIIMKVSVPLGGCTKTLRNITKSIKNYTRERKERKSRLEAVHEPYDQPASPQNRQNKVKKALRRLFQSRSRKPPRRWTIPIIVEQSSETHYSPPHPKGARSEAQALQARDFAFTTRHGLPVDFVGEALGRSVAALRGDVSFVDSGYGIDLAPYEGDLASSTNADIGGCGSFSISEVDPVFLTGAGDDERGLFIPVAGETIAVVYDEEAIDDAGGSHPLAWNPIDNSAVPPSDGGVEQSSSQNATMISENDNFPSVVLEPPQGMEPKFVEEQDLHTFSFRTIESYWKTDVGPLSPELSPMSMDFPALNSLPFEPSMVLPHYQIHDEQAPRGDLLYSGPPMFGTTSAPVRRGAATDWSLLLPAELLQEIFFYVLPDQASPTDWKLDTPWPNTSLRATLLDLRRVCQRWNDVVLTPCVWNPNAVAWSVATATKPDSRARLGCIELHSRWAHIAPVDTVSYEIGSELMTLISDEIMDAVFRSIASCRFARIVLPERGIVDTDLIQLYPDYSQEMSRLRVLSWTSPHSFDTILPPRWRLPWTSLRQAPWPQLTACFLNCPLEMEDCLYILQQCPGLNTIELNHIFSSGITSNNVPGSSPVHENLSSFKVSSTVDIDILISNIQLPNLTNLQLDLTSGGNDEPFQRLQRLNLPWGSLKNLTLKCAMALSDAYQLFSQAPLSLALIILEA
ncbi:hypothetical protein BDZ94DRAFT_1062548 [Collybia nuda]|uniref:F-box domain-containing protein n=1 Tax=Collybia nuda TaxID=64659 RepID=A0A9P5XYD0_9AGAR|nr:hypothetical protein BDZ94DRAFT_1062548 [Collybia nuda]